MKIELLRDSLIDSAQIEQDILIIELSFIVFTNHIIRLLTHMTKSRSMKTTMK